MANQSDNKKPNLVFGRVVDKVNRPLPHLLIHAFDRDMRSEELLGESITDRNGKYRIPWSHDQLHGRGKQEADLFMKVFTREKKNPVY